MFDFTVIVPVHDVAPYLEEALESVVGQSVGLERTQLVLIDDGSADGSGKLCRDFAARHPDNVVLVSQEHAGVSAARNEGMRHAEGRLVTFLDGDDRLGPRLLELAYAFFEEHPDVQALDFPVEYFDARSGPHLLAYKNATTHVADLEAEPNALCMSTIGVVFRAEALAGHAFDESMRISEDGLFVNQVLIGLGRVGLHADERYYYRKRASGGSAMDGLVQSREYYLRTPALLHDGLAEASRRAHGRLTTYAQRCIMYDLQWRLTRPVRCTELTAEERAAYRARLVESLWLLENRNIVAAHHLSVSGVLYAMALKYGAEPEDLCRHLIVRDGRLRAPLRIDGVFRNIPLRKMPTIDATVKICGITRTEGGVRLEGFCNTLCDDAGGHLRMRFLLDGETLPAAFEPWHNLAMDTPFHGRVLPKRGFVVDVPWQPGQTRRLTVRVALCKQRLRERLAFGHYAGLTERLPHSYLDLGDVCVLWKGGGDHDALVFAPSTPRGALRRERRLRQDLAADPEAAHMLRWRRIGFLRRLVPRRTQTWLIADRTFKAGDNGEALYKYLCEHPVKGVRPVFVISFDSPDYPRLRSYGGKLLDFTDDNVKRALLGADAFLTSTAGVALTKPFEADRDYVSDLLRYKAVFLQHGVTKDDQSRWLHKWSQHFSLFVTAAPRERDSIVSGPYGYRPDEVALVGFARHDGLLAEAKGHPPKRLLAIMPTWREPLARVVAGTGRQTVVPGFERSAFFRFYQALIQDERLNAALERHGFEAQLILHPAFISAAPLFSGTERVRVRSSCDYRETFLDAACLVTDFSSVAFDFALLKRPVIYAQFDRDAFFGTHLYRKGYFSYRDDGFGPVCEDLEGTVDAVVAALERGCAMEPVYERRVEDFFFWPERPRCELTVEAVQKLCADRRA